jgi:hypothetical protein
MSTAIVPDLRINPIVAALGTRKLLRDVRDEVVMLRDRRDEVTAAYAGGLPAETQSAEILVREIDASIRRAEMLRIGRPIDLVALMQQCRQDGKPLWGLVDPRQPVGRDNGGIDTDGSLFVGGRNLCGGRYDKLRVKSRDRLVPTGGIPPSPHEARAILSHPTVVNNARTVGLLYQPDAWTEMKTDPAIVVEWQDLPGQWFALCIWGGDRASIMEFVN